MYNCTLCNTEISTPALSGQTMVKTTLMSYWFCRKCTTNIPGANAGGYGNVKAQNERKEFWDGLKSKLEKVRKGKQAACK